MAENPLLQYLDVETPPPVQTTDTDSTANPLLQYIETTEEPTPQVETPKKSWISKVLRPSICSACIIINGWIL